VKDLYLFGKTRFFAVLRMTERQPPGFGTSFSFRPIREVLGSLCPQRGERV
jgi:hypothetical protein